MDYYPNFIVLFIKNVFYFFEKFMTLEVENGLDINSKSGETLIFFNLSSENSYCYVILLKYRLSKFCCIKIFLSKNKMNFICIPNVVHRFFTF